MKNTEICVGKLYIHLLMQSGNHCPQTDAIDSSSMSLRTQQLLWSAVNNDWTMCVSNNIATIFSHAFFEKCYFWGDKKWLLKIGEIPGGRGVFQAPFVMEIPGSRGYERKKPSVWGYGYFLESHIVPWLLLNITLVIGPRNWCATGVPGYQLWLAI